MLLNNPLSGLIVYVLLIVRINCAQNPYCSLSCDYGADPVLHTICERGGNQCGPDPRCGPDFKIVRLTEEQRKIILNLHNGLRCRVGLGKEVRGKQPSAADMRVMSYDRELEFIAQCWANSCNGASLIHDHCRRTKQFDHVGQNIGFVNSTDNNINFTTAIKQLIRFWYDEVGIFNNQWINDTRDRGPDFKVGHYTQMMWADTHRVGCAGAYYTVKSPLYGRSYEFSFICNYGPGGNYLGSPVYKTGQPGSACPNKLRHNNQCGMCGSFRNASKYDQGFKPLFKL